MSRIDVLKTANNDKCVCQGEWLECAKEILHNNGIEQNTFAHAIVKLLAMGRGKGRNLYITGPANCGKPFILDPLRIIYKPFISPATCSYVWLGVEDTEVIFLNDFRYTPAILPWSDMLLLLESHVVHFLHPKRHTLEILSLQAIHQFLQRPNHQPSSSKALFWMKKRRK